MALYDAIGGYLYSVAIPILNEAYYAGNVDYRTTSQLHSMLGRVMDSLGTNGHAWAPPCDMSQIPTKVCYLYFRHDFFFLLNIYNLASFHIQSIKYQI